MAFKEGDFVKVEYTAKHAADNSVVYTTDESIAKKNNIFEEERRYGPQLMVIGKRKLIKGLDDAIKDMNLNQERKLELEPKDAFGERNPDLVRVMSLSDFKKRDIDPYPGMRLDIDGGVATVKSVNSGRVVVDANHPLAGEKLIYEIRVVSKIDGTKEKIEALAEEASLKPSEVRVDGSTATILFGAEIEKNSDYLINKAGFAESVLRDMDEISKLHVNEEYVRKEKK